MTYEQLSEQKEFILLDCISGSQAYNLNLPASDIDKKGIFILPKTELFGFEFQEQVSNDTNDEVYFEIKRFLDLLTKNNPNILELLNTPANCILARHPLMDLINPADFLSKLCFQTFAGYAQSQIKKANGLNKKINNPVEKHRKSILEFCYVVYKNGSVPVLSWLKENKLNQEDCGLVSLDHFRNGYLLYHKNQLGDGSHLKGIIYDDNSDDVLLSSVPKDVQPLAVMNFNKDGYSIYCREYKEYREWEKNRNQVRFENTLANGKNYDSKNIMHTFRLLNMAEEIALYQQVIVYREDRDFLLSIRGGSFEFDELMEMADSKMKRIKNLYTQSKLPERPDVKNAEKILIQIREEFYSR